MQNGESMATTAQPVKTPKLVFISHNKADEAVALSLAQALVDQGIGVWFDAWVLHPGDSIVGGITDGLEKLDLFALIWSKNAANSKWVKKELQASIYRHISDDTIRVVPVMLDDTPLPALVADLFGFRYASPKDVLEIAAKIGGDSTPEELARRLQKRFFEMLDVIGESSSFNEYRFCPKCGSKKLKAWQQSVPVSDRQYAGIRCESCGWEDGGEF